MSDKNITQVAIIGAGPGGYAAAFRAADLGLDVSLIDPRENPGGVCLYEGCIPTKALLHFAEVKEDALEAQKFGLEYTDLSVDIDKLRKWKNSVVKQLTGGLGQLSKARKIKYIRGTASFTDKHTLTVKPHEGEKYEINFDKAIIATGARAATLPKVKVDGKKIMTAKSALQLTDIPKTMAIIGAGYIGLELGSIFHALGTKITYIEMEAGIMPGTDKDLSNVIRKEKSALLKNTYFNTKVLAANNKADGVELSLQKNGGEKEKQSFDKVLVAIGELPNSENLNLEALPVETDKKGFIKVNTYRQTSQEHIYAIGDVAGEPLLAHKASYEGRVAAEHIAGKKTAYEPKAIPAIVFVGLAWTGLTEKMAEKQGRKVKISRFPWAASGRVATLGKRNGLTKLIIDPDSGRLLGAGFAGKNAETLVAEANLAIEMAAVAKDLELTIHPHPTLSETIMEAAEMFYGKATHTLKSNQ